MRDKWANKNNDETWNLNAEWGPRVILNGDHFYRQKDAKHTLNLRFGTKVDPLKKITKD